MQNSDSPAFPVAKLPIDEPSGYGGLTKREYAAIMAMSAIDPPSFSISGHQLAENHMIWAKKCVQMADALLSELEKPQSPLK